MNNDVVDPHLPEAIFQKKRSPRSNIRIELKSMDPIQRSQEDSYSSFSAQEGNRQMQKELYVPQVKDTNSNMKMLKISSVKALVANSMNILEPALLDSDGNQHKDGSVLTKGRIWCSYEASEPVELFI